MKKMWLGTLLILPLAFTATWAADPTPGNPDTNASDRNYDTNQPNSIPGGMQKSEDAANRAMNKVDKGVHKGIHKTKRGMHKASHSTKEGYDKMMEPAKKPDTTTPSNP